MQTELGFDENTCDSASSAYGAFQSLVKSQLSSLWERCNHNEVRVYEHIMRNALFCTKTHVVETLYSYPLHTRTHMEYKNFILFELQFP